MSNPADRFTPATIKKGVVYGLIIASILVYLLMWLSVEMEVLFFQFDEPAKNWFMELNQRTPEWIDTIGDIFTRIGSQGITVATIVLLALYVFRRRFRRFWLLFTSVVGGELLWLLMIFLVNRPRPTEVVALVGVTLPGFPSGHVMIFIAFFGALFYIYLPEIKKRNLQLPILAFLTILCLISGFIRLYFSAHFLTDVIGGYSIGLAWTAVAITVVDWVWLKRHAKSEPTG